MLQRAVNSYQSVIEIQQQQLLLQQKEIDKSRDRIRQLEAEVSGLKQKVERP